MGVGETLLVSEPCTGCTPFSRRSSGFHSPWGKRSIGKACPAALERSARRRGTQAGQQHLGRLAALLSQHQPSWAGRSLLSGQHPGQQGPSPGSARAAAARGWYSRVGTLPVAGSVLDAPTRGVAPGPPRAPRGEASPVCTSASHPAHGAARAAGTPGAAGSPWTCKDGSVSASRPWALLEERAQLVPGPGHYLHGVGGAFLAAPGGAAHPSCCSWGPSSVPGSPSACCPGNPSLEEDTSRVRASSWHCDPTTPCQGPH